MKKTNIILVLIAMISLLGLGAVVLIFGDSDTIPTGETSSSLEEYKDNYVTNTGMNKEIIVTVQEEFAPVELQNIYTEQFQQSVRTRIDGLISANVYTEDNPLVIYNPFGTNNQSLYVYFTTQEPYAVSYSVHTPEASYEDFGGNVVPNRPDTSKIHEFQITGLIPNETNMITIRMMDENGAVKIRRFYYYNDNEVAATTLELQSEQGMKQVENEDKTFSTVPASEENVAEGMFLVFPAVNELSPYLRLYDNDGVQRAEFPLVSFGTKKALLLEDLMFFRVSEYLLVGMNRLGEVVKFYTAENYTFGEDYCFDKENNILVLASDKRQDSIDDCILLLDRVSTEVTELVDLGNLLPEYKITCPVRDGVRDWLGLNSIVLVEGNRIMVSAGKPDAVIKIRRLYNDPKIAFMVGDASVFQETSYGEYFLRIDNEFEMHAGINQVLYEEYDKIRETRHYICVLNSNDNYEYAKKEEPFSYYYRYLIDEAEEGVRLMDSVVLPGVEDDGSMQWYGNHFILASDMEPAFYEYDAEFQLIRKYYYEEPVVKKTEEQMEEEEDHPLPDGTVKYLGVQKLDLTGYYFTEEPVLILPNESETEGALPENE